MIMSKKNKQKSCSGDATFHECGKNATVLFEEDWDEIVRSQGKKAGEPYVVPEHGVISIRVPEEFRGQPLRVFAAKMGV